MKFKWEELSFFVDEEKCQKTWRARVEGGWIVNNFHAQAINDEHHSISESMVFVPDPEYNWKIDDK